MFHVELIASSFLDLISKQARMNAAVSAFLFLMSHFRTSARSELSFTISLFASGEEAKICRSSAYIHGVVNFRLSGKSLMYSRNKSGPRID